MLRSCCRAKNMPLHIKDDNLTRRLDIIKYDKEKPEENTRLSFPYEIKNVDPEINLQLLKDFTGERTGFVQVGPKKWFFPSGYAKEAENFYNFKFKKEDVIVMTFPRSGTTWTQEMVWLLCNDLDYEKAANLPLSQRSPFLEFSCFVHKDTKQDFLRENMSDPEKYKAVQNIDYPAWKLLSITTGQRFIKTHLPFSLLPPDLTKIGCKVIYVARNPKDVAVSFYHLNKSIRTQGYTGDFKKYWYYFQKNLQPWTPYWEHIKEGWSKRSEENVQFMFYENMRKNLRSSMEKLATFFEKSYSTEELDILENHLKFENFKNNKSVNMEVMKNLGITLRTGASFVRCGKTGGWRNYFDQELEKKANQWIEKNLKDTDLRFPL